MTTSADTAPESVVADSPEGALFEPEVFKALREVSDSPQERGRIFERVMRAAFERNPQYSDRFESVWLWSDWPDRSKFGYGGDSGVDLVVAEREGGVCAIQCKLYEAGAKVPSSDINSFLAEAGKEPFTSSLLVNTGELTGSSWSKIENATKRCDVLSSFELESWQRQMPRNLGWCRDRRHFTDRRTARLERCRAPETAAPRPPYSGSPDRTRDRSTSASHLFAMMMGCLCAG